MKPYRAGGVFALYLTAMGRGHYKSVNKGIPALVCVPTGETVIIGNTQYKVLKLMYDLKGIYLPLALPIGS